MAYLSRTTSFHSVVREGERERGETGRFFSNLQTVGDVSADWLPLGAIL
jgi:hypothetical protein